MNSGESVNQIISFYGSEHPRMFEIERRCMDRDGLVIRHLDREVPHGLVLDVGAGNGFTAVRLSSTARRVVPLEPDPGMIDRIVPLMWVRGIAQSLPFVESTFDAAYATWAFFFEEMPGVDKGLDELNRVVKEGGRLIIVDNAGDDEFSRLAGKSMGGDPAWWRSRGFRATLIRTSYRFDSLEEANRLLKFYFGANTARRNSSTEIEYRVVAYSTSVRKQRICPGD